MISIGSSGNRTPRSIEVREPDQTCVLVDDADVDDLCVEDLLDPVADQVVHRLHLELLGETPLDVVDERQLGVPLARLLEQARVLERDAQASGDRRQQPHVGFAERVLPVQVVQRDDARPSAPHEERNEHRRLGRLARDRHWVPRLFAPSFHVLVDDNGFPRLQRDLAEPHDLDRMVDQPLTTLERIGEPDLASLVIDHADVHGLRVEDLVDPFADEVVHRLHLEVLGEPALDVVDQRELGVPLACLLEETRVLERDAEAARERREQADVRLAERMLMVDVLERDPAGRLAPDDQRHVDGRLHHLALEDRAAELLEAFRESVVR